MRFLSEAQTETIRSRFGTPTYVYDQTELENSARTVLNFPVPCRLTARFAMKALPTAEVLRIFNAAGLHFDASSGFEAQRAMRAGVDANRIQITAQELPKDLKGLVQLGVRFNACSLHQLRVFGGLFPGAEVSVRMNPGAGSGHNNRTNTGGPASSFGIWHEKMPEVLATAREFDLRITGMHTHIGSGGDPEIWKHCAKLTFEMAAQLPDLNRLSLGGGFKVARVPGEVSADLTEIGEALLPSLREFVASRGGADFELEIEPGTFLVANAGAILAEIIDVTDTGADGYHFLKVDTGMTELLRPALYGAQHPLTVVAHGHEPSKAETNYIVAGHCCESSDILTPAPADPEGLSPRTLAQAEIGDTLVIEGAGAYASGLAGKNYNSFPEAAEVMIGRDGEPRLIRERQTLEQALQNEL